MVETTAGGFEYRGHAFRFQAATCGMDAAGSLYVHAAGDHCRLALLGVPFPGVRSVADLPGQAWQPGEDELADRADVFAKGGLEVSDTPLEIRRGRIACTRFDPERGMLVVSYHLSVQDDEDGREDEVEGVAYCRVE